MADMPYLCEDELIVVIVMKPVFRTDVLMAVLFVASVITGVNIHLADHADTHEMWHNWSGAHVVVNVVFLVVASVHIKQHWGWFKSFFKAKDLKRKITRFVTIAFLAVVASGIYLLLFAEGPGTHARLVHWWIGVIFTVVGLGHFIKRFPILKKGIKH